MSSALKTRRRAQTTVEYALLCAIVAGFAVTVSAYFKPVMLAIVRSFNGSIGLPYP